jgi:hypothetical protein
MSERTIKLSVRARGEVDSPTVEDLLDQVRDHFEILKGVEQAIAEDGTNAIEWRIVSATTNSPIAFEAKAFARDFAVNIDQRVELVTRQTALGLRQLEEGGERPSYFTDKVLLRAEKLFERVTNGLDKTIIDFGKDLPVLDITPTVARRAAANIQRVLKPENKPYEELGSVEGSVDSIERDGWGKPIVRVRLRLTGEVIKCFVSGEALKLFEGHQIRDVWRGRRVRLHGKLKYKGLGLLSQVEAFDVKFLRDRKDLPDVEDILDDNFTGGLRTEDYLTRIRNGDPS